MKKKVKLGIIGGIVIALSSGYIFLSNINKEQESIMGIYLDSEAQLKSEEIKKSKKLDSKYIGYIEGEVGKENSEGALNKLSFKELSLNIPKYFNEFTNVEDDNMISIKTIKKNVKDKDGKNNINIHIMDNNENKTVEDYVKNFEIMDESAKANRDFDARALKEVLTDKNIIKAKYDVNFELLANKDNINSANFKVYNYIVLQNNKIYNIEYSYDNEDIGNTVIDILNKSITVNSL